MRYHGRRTGRSQRGFIGFGGGAGVADRADAAVPPSGVTDVAVHATGTASENGTALQAAIDAAATNTRILLDKDGIYEGPFTIDGKTDLWIETVGIDTDPTLPGRTTHVTPTTGAHLAMLRLNGYGSDGCLLKTINVSHGIRLRGLQCAFVDGSIGNGTATEWLQFGANDQTRANVPKNCHLDRILCNRTAWSATNNVKNFVDFHVRDSTMRRCYFEGAIWQGGESHCVNIDRTTGGLLFEDNFFGTSTIGVLVGGGGAWTGFVTSRDDVPCGFVFRRNHWKKNTKYHHSIGDGGGFTSPEVMLLKGGLEFKAGKGIIIDGNVFETIYSAGDVNVSAISFSMKCNTYFSGSPYMVADESCIRHNVFFNCPTIFETTVASDAAGSDNPGDEVTDWTATSGITIEHNVVYGMTRDAPIGSGTNATGHFVLLDGAKNVTIQHNTVHTGGNTGTGGMFYFDNHNYPNGTGTSPDTDLTGLLIRNNYFGTFTLAISSQGYEYDLSVLLPLVAINPSILKNYAVDDGDAVNWPGGTAAMAAANANAFWTDFGATPTQNADYSLLTLGNWTPQATLAGYGTATGSTGYAHPCADWSRITTALGRLYTELTS